MGNIQCETHICMETNPYDSHLQKTWFMVYYLEALSPSQSEEFYVESMCHECLPTRERVNDRGLPCPRMLFMCGAMVDYRQHKYELNK